MEAEEMNKENILKIVNGNISYIEKIKVDDDLSNIKVIIKPVHIKNMLLSYLKGEVSSNGLSYWANFILQYEGECIYDERDRETIRYYKKMWNIIQALSMPELHGNVTPELTLQYISDLDKPFKESDTFMEKSIYKKDADKDDLLKILNGDVSHIDEINTLNFGSSDTDVFVFPCHVKKMLVDFLDGKINAFDLNRWALFVSSRSEYTSEGWEDDALANYYEDMWEVIQKLCSPQIDGDITPERVREYLKELDKYFNKDK